MDHREVGLQETKIAAPAAEEASEAPSVGTKAQAKQAKFSTNLTPKAIIFSLNFQYSSDRSFF